MPRWHFKGRDFNLHMPTVVRYQRMAETFESIRVGLVGREMSPDEVIEILKIRAPSSPRT